MDLTRERSCPDGTVYATDDYVSAVYTCDQSVAIMPGGGPMWTNGTIRYQLAGSPTGAAGWFACE